MKTLTVAALCLALTTATATAAQARSDKELCRELAEILFRTSQTSRELTERLAGPSYDQLIRTLEFGSAERDALTKFRDEAYAALAAVRKINEAADRTSKVMHACSGG